MDRRTQYLHWHNASAKPIEGELTALQVRLTAAADACHVPRAAVRVELEDKEIDLVDVVRSPMYATGVGLLTLANSRAATLRMAR